MVVSKGRKIVLIAILVVIVAIAIAGGVFALKTYSDTQSKIDYAVNGLLDINPVGGTTAYDEDTASEYIENYWNPLKDQSGFQEKLASQLKEQILDVALQNNEMDDSEQIENQYGDALLPSETNETLQCLITFFDEVGYEDPAIRESILSYYVQLVEMELSALENTAEESKLNVSGELMDALSYVDGFNQFAGSFYQIQEDELISESDKDKIAEFYRQTIQQSYDTGDVSAFAEALSQVSQSTFFENQTFMESDKIVAFLTDDSNEIYTLKPGIGGYYDIISQEPNLYYDGNSYAGGNGSFYGDFYYAYYEGSQDQYDMSEMSPEVWGALTPGQREEIRRGNSSSSEIVSYLQGVELDSTYIALIPELAESDFEFAYCTADGDAIFLSQNAVCYFPASGGEYLMKGDFSDQVSKAEEQYSAQIAVMQSAVSAIVQGDHDAATKDFKSFSNNGTNLSHICWFAAELMRHNVLDEGLEIIYGNINLPEEDMIQLEVFLSKLF